MTLQTSDFPQADRLEKVGDVARAVASGLRSDAEIEDFIGLESADRQGRYYRKAAELLDLVKTAQNRSELTDNGRTFVKLESDDERQAFLAMLLTRTELFTRVSREAVQSRCTENELRSFATNLYPGAESTGARRASTVIAYLTQSGLLSLVDGRFRPGLLGGLLEPRGRVADPKRRPPTRAVPTGSLTDEILTVEIQRAKLERANLIHEDLVRVVANWGEMSGASIEYNELIDLLMRGSQDVIFEMKSISETNRASQLRRAVSQLYEYRYRFNLPDAALAIVTNLPAAAVEPVYLSFLEEDRHIAYVWVDEAENLRYSRASGALLGLAT